MTVPPPEFDPHTCTPQEMHDLYRGLHAAGCPVFPSPAHWEFHMVSSHPGGVHPGPGSPRPGSLGPGC